MSTSLSRDLSLTSLILAVVTGTIGSGWLLAPYFTARLDGSASLLALLDYISSNLPWLTVEPERQGNAFSCWSWISRAAHHSALLGCFRYP